MYEIHRHITDGFVMELNTKNNKKSNLISVADLQAFPKQAMFVV